MTRTLGLAARMFALPAAASHAAVAGAQQPLAPRSVVAALGGQVVLPVDAEQAPVDGAFGRFLAWLAGVPPLAQPASVAAAAGVPRGRIDAPLDVLRMRAAWPGGFVASAPRSAA
jgi:hypothetical protein